MTEQNNMITIRKTSSKKTRLVLQKYPANLPEIHYDRHGTFDRVSPERAFLNKAGGHINGF